MTADHGELTPDVSLWIGLYRRRTPGVRQADGATLILGEFGEPQPDNLFRIEPERGGACYINEENYLTGPPELVVEVAKSSRPFDLGGKRHDYECAGVKEYIVVAIDPSEVHWHVRRGDKLKRILPDPDGIYRSAAFPGLWLDPVALLKGDIEGVIAALDRGLATPNTPPSSPASPTWPRGTRTSPEAAFHPAGPGEHAMSTIEKVNLLEKLARFHEQWKPRIAGELDGQQVKLVRFQGEFVWHHHEHEDELFLVVKGRFRMEFRDREVWLEEGEFLIVPRGVEHRPVAEEEAQVLLFEPASTLNTGNVHDERTIEDLERI